MFCRLRGIVLLVFVASGSAPTLADARQHDRVTAPFLDAGATVEGALAGGESSRHALALRTGQAATVFVVHRKIDVVLRVLDTGGKAHVEIASDQPNGELRLRIVAADSAPHNIEVAATYPKSAPGGYVIRIEDVTAASARDRQLWDASVQQTRANQLRSTGNLAEALSSAEQALALREKALGADARDVARSLLLLAQIDDALAKLKAAEELYRRAREMGDRNEGRDELTTAAVLDAYARHCIILARFGEAEPLITKALAIRERLLGSNHVVVAASLATLADLHHEQSTYQEAAKAADRALAVAAKTYEPTDVALGEFTNRVARAAIVAGNFARAEELYRSTLDVAAARAGAESPTFLESLAGLSRVALRANDNVKAEQLHAQVLALRERIHGPAHPEVASDLLNIAVLHYRRRDYTTAMTLNQKALTIWEKTVGASHQKTALGLNNAGLMYWRQGDYRRAEEFYRRALELTEQAFGVDSLRVASSLGNLGIIAKETGNYDLAETRYKRALAILEKNYGPMHPELIATVESLGILYRDRGDYPLAAEMFERTVRITETSLGHDHPFVARHLDNIAQMYRAMGDWTRSFRALQRMFALEERYIPLNLSIGSERQKLAYFEPRLSNLEELISFHAQQPIEHPEARDLALTTLLQRKGRVLDALADNLTAFRRRARAEDQALFDRLTSVTSDLAALTLTDARTDSPDRQRRATVLAGEREQLEIELHRRSAGYLEPTRAVTLDAVQRAVPSDAAVLEFALYRSFDARLSFESGKQYGAPRYIVYVLRNRGEPQWRDLGPAADIDALVERFRAALADPKRADAGRVATDLHQKLLATLQPLWGDAKHLLISPEGTLNLIPFEALRSVTGRFLVEDVAISYLTTGRDLVRMAAPRPETTRAVVFGNPQFGEPLGEPTTRTAGSSATAYFAPLAGTATEAHRIGALFQGSDLKLGDAASERALKDLQAPRILHIATHGFFLQEKGSEQNPLLRSGLALAGANRRGNTGDDGILTALETANLNLWGTKLVTLSACDTGVGVVRNGEGVYGLRRAVFLAGAESLVMSLWPVSDQITREMMIGYYSGLKEGLGRGAALRRIQLKMMKRPERSHPFYWASFIQAGEWANLDGRR